LFDEAALLYVRALDAFGFWKPEFFVTLRVLLGLETFLLGVLLFFIPTSRFGVFLLTLLGLGVVFKTLSCFGMLFTFELGLGVFRTV